MIVSKQAGRTPRVKPPQDHLIVTIDGPAGTGKSSVGRMLALQLGLEFLDTGAMYRAATARAIDAGVDLNDEQAVASLALEADFHFDWKADPPTLLACGNPYDERLRDDDVTRMVSAVSALAALREVLVRKQKLIGAQHPRLVSEGRDQGSVVFPDANVKLYLHASARVRAERRAAQLLEAGRPVDLDALEKELEDRDRSDAGRAVGPLKKPDDAIVIDTSNLSFEQVVDKLEQVVRAQLSPSAPAGG